MANVGGVQYMSPNMAAPAMPGGGGGGNPLINLLSGMKLGAEVGGLVEKQIDVRRTRREVDKLMAELKDDKAPTQDWFKRAVRYMGPDGAGQIASFHDMTRKWKTEDRKAAFADLSLEIDLGGGIVDNLRQLPEEQRPDAFAAMLQPLMQNPEGQELARSIAERYKDGVFTDDRLDAHAAQAAAWGRYQTIHDNRITAAAKKAEKAADRESKERIARIDAAAKIAELKIKNPPRSEIIREAQAMVKEFGGSPADWAIFLGSDDKMIGESDAGDGGWVNKATNRPLNLGSYANEALPPGSQLGEGPAPGSPATIKRRRSR